MLPLFLQLLLHIWVILYSMKACMLCILTGRRVLDRGSLKQSVVAFSPSVHNLLQNFSSMLISCYQLCHSAALERFLSTECIPAECLCLVYHHVACLIYVIMSELLLWFPQDSVSNTSICVSTN